MHERNFCNSNALNLLSRGHSFTGTCMITDQDFSDNITTFVRQEWGLEIYIHPLKNSLRSSPFLSFFRRRRDRTSERKAGERRSTPAWGEQKNWGEVGRWRASPLPPRLILPLFRSFPPVRERLEKERKRLLHRLTQKS